MSNQADSPATLGRKAKQSPMTRDQYERYTARVYFIKRNTGAVRSIGAHRQVQLSLQVSEGNIRAALSTAVPNSAIINALYDLIWDHLKAHSPLFVAGKISEA